MDQVNQNVKPAAEEKAMAPELGFMELLRAPDEAADQAESDPTERVLARRRPSAWDF